MEDKNGEGKKEYYKVSGADILKKIEEIIKEGNARRILIKNEKDEVIIEFPVTVGVVGVILAPILAAVGAVAALVASCTIVVEKK